MAIPDTIKKYRPKGTEIQEHGGHYYVYKVKAYYDPETKKSKRKSEGCIGQIFEGIGFVSNSKSKSCNNSVKEYGATAFLTANSEEVKKSLVDIFGMDGFRIYVLAILKLLTNSNSKNMETAYKKSYISEMLPEVHISKNTLTDFLQKLSLERPNMLKLFNTVQPNKGDNIIFDGTSFSTNSKGNPYVNRGYNPNDPNAKQIRLIYGFNVDSNIPVYFSVVAGNITDKMAFVSSFKESGLKDCSVILDNGFYSAKNLNYLTSAGINFIIPINHTLKVVKEFDVRKFDTVHKHFMYHKRTINYIWLQSDFLEKYNLYVYYDLERRRELLNNYYSRNGIKEDTLSSDDLKKLEDETKYFGVTFLVASEKIGAEATYRQFKKRWNIEEMFDSHKNTLCFDMSYEVKEKSQCGWAFIEFVALLIYMKAEAALSNHKETKSLEVHDALLRYSAVVKCKIGNDWEIWNLDKETEKQLELLSVITS